jgi:phosphoglycerol transferase MdoB-like AlkP superfamily enzyme
LVWGYIVRTAMGVVVALPELLSAVTDVGFPTISGTVGYLEYWHPEFALLAVGLLVWGAFHAIRQKPSTLPRPQALGAVLRPRRIVAVALVVAFAVPRLARVAATFATRRRSPAASSAGK